MSHIKICICSFLVCAKEIKQYSQHLLFKLLSSLQYILEINHWFWSHSLKKKAVITLNPILAKLCIQINIDSLKIYHIQVTRISQENPNTSCSRPFS